MIREMAVKARRIIISCRRRGYFGRNSQVDAILPVSMFDSCNKTETYKFAEAFKKIKKDYDLIRVHKLWSSRLGEIIGRYIVASMDVNVNQRKRILDLFVLTDYKECNSFLIELMARNMHVVTCHSFVFWRYVLKRYPKVDTWRHYSDYISRDEKVRVFPEDIEPLFEMTSEEMRYGQKRLIDMGIKRDFICFSSRDPQYLKMSNPDFDYSYHDYRDSDINNNALAIDYLETEGIQAVHFGRNVKEAKIGNCVKYAEDFYEDFMDFYLLKRCKFFLSDNSGIVVPAMSMDTPVALKNYVPLNGEGYQGIPQGNKNLYIFKKYYYPKEERYLTAREMLKLEKNADFTTEFYCKNGVEVHENSKEEIFDLAKEMNDRLDGKWKDTPEDEEMQMKFQKLLHDDIIKNKKVANACIHCRVATTFLRRNKWILADL